MPTQKVTQHHPTVSFNSLVEYYDLLFHACSIIFHTQAKIKHCSVFQWCPTQLQIIQALSPVALYCTIWIELHFWRDREAQKSCSMSLHIVFHLQLKKPDLTPSWQCTTKDIRHRKLCSFWCLSKQTSNKKKAAAEKSPAIISCSFLSL